MYNHLFRVGTMPRSLHWQHPPPERASSASNAFAPGEICNCCWVEQGSLYHHPKQCTVGNINPKCSRSNLHPSKILTSACDWAGYKPRDDQVSGHKIYITPGRIVFRIANWLLRYLQTYIWIYDKYVYIHIYNLYQYISILYIFLAEFFSASSVYMFGILIKNPPSTNRHIGWPSSPNSSR